MYINQPQKAPGKTRSYLRGVRQDMQQPISMTVCHGLPWDWRTSTSREQSLTGGPRDTLFFPIITLYNCIGMDWSRKPQSSHSLNWDDLITEREWNREPRHTGHYR